MNEELKEMTSKIEFMILKKIVTSVRDQSITPLQAKEFAQTFLSIEPFESFEDAKAKITQYAMRFPLFEEAKAYIEAYHYEQKVNAVVEKMQNYIGQNNLDEALKVAQNG